MSISGAVSDCCLRNKKCRALCLRPYQKKKCAVLVALCLGVLLAIYESLSGTQTSPEVKPVSAEVKTFKGPVFNLADTQIVEENAPGLIDQPEVVLESHNVLRSRPEPFERSNDFQEISDLFLQTRVKCSALFAGDRKSTERAVGIARVLAELELVKYSNSTRLAKLAVEGDISPRHPSQKLVREVKQWPRWEFERLTNQWYLRAASDCDSFKRGRGYITTPLTKEEEQFPIAFSIVVYKDIEMVERLLRSIYRPQNRYCIHVDLHADQEFAAAVDSVAACFNDNVKMSTKRVVVKWGTYSTLEPELICMGDLLHWEEDDDDDQDDHDEENYEDIDDFDEGLEYHKDDEEIKTGGRDSHSEDKPELPGDKHDDAKDPKKKTKRKWMYFINLTGQEFPLKTNYEIVKILKAFGGANNEEGTFESAEKYRWKSTPPHGIKAIKGAVHTILNRPTVHYIMNNPIAQDFLEWLKTTEIPDETLFASINYNKQLSIRGIYRGKHMESVKAFARFKKWNWKPDYGGCPSQLVVKNVCILSTGDLKEMGESPHLFANKFLLEKDRIVIGCLEERIFNNTRDEYMGKKKFDTSLYANQDFVRNQIKDPYADYEDDNPHMDNPDQDSNEN